MNANSFTVHLNIFKKSNACLFRALIVNDFTSAVDAISICMFFYRVKIQYYWGSVILFLLLFLLLSTLCNIPRSVDPVPPLWTKLRKEIKSVRFGDGDLRELYDWKIQRRRGSHCGRFTGVVLIEGMVLLLAFGSGADQRSPVYEDFALLQWLKHASFTWI